MGKKSQKQRPRAEGWASAGGPAAGWWEVQWEADGLNAGDDGTESTTSRFTRGFRPTKLCKYRLSGRCFRGDRCTFAHDESELRPEALGAGLDEQRAAVFEVEWKADHLDPGDDGKSRVPAPAPIRGAEPSTSTSRFAWECRPTRLCKYQLSGWCSWGDRCTFAHDESELRPEAVGATSAGLGDAADGADNPENSEGAKARETLEAEKFALKNRLLVLEQDATGLRQSLLAQTAAHAKTRQDFQKAIADLTAEVKRKQDDAEDARQTLAREKMSFDDQLRTKEEALAEAMRVSNTSWAKLQDVEDLATTSFAQWFWSDNQGAQLPFGLAENLQVEKAHQAYCSRSFSGELFELKIGDFQYIIDFGSMLQTNKKTRKQRLLTRKVVDGHQTTDVVEKVRQALAAKSMEAAAHQTRSNQERSGAHKDAAALERELRAAKAEGQDLRGRLEEAEKKLQEALAGATAQKAQHDAALAQSIETEAGERRKAVEFWRTQAPGACLVIEPLSLKVQGILQAYAHKQHIFRASPSQCIPFQQIKVHAVRAVHNPTAHRAYQLCLETMSKNHKHLKIQVPPLRPVACSVALSFLFPGIVLNAELNEVLLMHGCKDAATSSIVTEGFDIRHTRSGSWYGEGVYFSSEACKCHQYTGTAQMKHMFIARVALGDPAFLTAKRQGRHPPTRACGIARYDSAVVDPAKSTCDQHHWEYVIYKGEQACPELLVTYSV